MGFACDQDEKVATQKELLWVINLCVRRLCVQRNSVT